MLLDVSLPLFVVSSTGVCFLFDSITPASDLTFSISEHLGLIPPQNCEPGDPVTSFMHAAPIPNNYDDHSREDGLVADPLSDETMALWQSTAKKNRDIFTEVFRPVPSDLVQNFEVYKVCLLFFF